MRTIFYLIRHAQKADSKLFNNIILETEEPSLKILTIEGEKQALELSKLDIFENISVIYSSHFARTIGTAKYLAKRLNLKINVDHRLKERLGLLADRSPERDKLFYFNSYHDFNYRESGGESVNDTKKRMISITKELLDMYLGKEIAIFTHNTAIFALLSSFCEVGYNLDDEVMLNYNEDLTFSVLFESPDIIKLTFEEKDLIDIERINYRSE